MTMQHQTQNPFRYGAKVTGGAFYDRREIKNSMENAIDGGNNVVLYGPRRYGKSSLVAEMMTELQARGTVCVYLNIMNFASLADFVIAYTKAVYDQLAPAAAALKHISGFFRRIRPVVRMSEDGRPEMSFSFDSGKIGVAELREAFELPEKLRPRRSRLVIVLDEFQEVAEFGLGARFEQVMRSVIENHSEIGYVFLGSKTHMLKRMFAAPSRPFYRSAQTFSLALPPEDEGLKFLVDKFTSVGMSIGAPVAKKIVELSGNVPYYLQALGSWTFRVASELRKNKISAADVDNAFEMMYDAERDLFESMFRALPESQRLVARALALEPAGVMTDEYRTRHFLPNASTVGTAIRRLVADSRIDMVDGLYRHLDPVFAHHLRRTSPM